MILQLIFLYASFAVVDVCDKFLISRRKIQAWPYTFYTVVTGALLLLAWPWFFQPLPARFIFLDLLSGAYYGLVMFVFYKVLAEGEVSRVVPFVFGLVPVFDVCISLFTGRSALSARDLSVMAMLIPGALLIAYQPGRFLHKHLGLTVLSAFLFSSYNFLWQYGAQVGSSLNNLMWNRLAAAGVLILLLVLPAARKRVFSAGHVPAKRHTSLVFVFKQILGGLNFILLSYFLATGKVPIVDGLSGFRYAFLFLFSLLLGWRYRQVLAERLTPAAVWQKAAAITLIVLGTVILFV